MITKENTFVADKPNCCHKCIHEWHSECEGCRGERYTPIRNCEDCGSETCREELEEMDDEMRKLL